MTAQKDLLLLTKNLMLQNLLLVIHLLYLRGCHEMLSLPYYFTLKKDYAQGYADIGTSGRIVEARFDFKNPLYKNLIHFFLLYQKVI